MQGVLVCSGCSNRAPAAGRLIRNKNVFLIVLEVGNLRLGMSAWLGTGESFLLGCCFAFYPHMLEGTREDEGAFWGLKFFFKLRYS